MKRVISDDEETALFVKKMKVPSIEEQHMGKIALYIFFFLEGELIINAKNTHRQLYIRREQYHSLLPVGAYILVDEGSISPRCRQKCTITCRSDSNSCTDDEGASDHDDVQEETSDEEKSDEEKSDEVTSDEETSDEETSDGETSDKDVSNHEDIQEEMSDEETSDGEVPDHKDVPVEMSDEDSFSESSVSSEEEQYDSSGNSQQINGRDSSSSFSSDSAYDMDSILYVLTTMENIQ
ncbi:hypothetical protein INT47_001993 [Mucor saturninus]|uniref:Uncharacterized protein n=1 Tax=Mucor saturninus TaxID=64648 RepID=A0A8H7VCW2_9FUNG|nr:hypothetical protein INT47_001993 [Mucor saturninus]